MKPLQTTSPRQKSFGIGKTYYPVRIAGFGIAGIVQAVFLYQHPDYVHFTSLFFTFWAFAWAHVAYAAYWLTGFNKKTEITALLLDNFWVGFFVNVMGFDYLPSLLCIAMTCANNMSVRGLGQFLRGFALLGLGILAGGVVHQFRVCTDNTLFLDLLSGFFLVTYFTYFGSLVFRRTTFVKKVSQEMKEQKEQIERQQTDLANQNKQILASITYAKRIQHAILPFPDRIRQFLPEFFVFYQPKDIVSGDFYWFSPQPDRLFLVVADCTGHGVPGAFMSMVGSSILDYLILEKKLVKTDEILTEMHQKVRQSLKQGEADNRDGMEVAVLVIDSVAQQIRFGGARMGMVYVIDRELVYLRGSKFPIGGQHYEDRYFTETTLELSPMMNGIFYLYTDGYQDQFGERTQRKFLSKNLRQFLFEIHEEKIEDQRQRLADNLEQWKGSEKQIDDILIVGFSLKGLIFKTS